MPATEAQKRASRNWRLKHKEHNKEIQKAYNAAHVELRREMNRRGSYKVWLWKAVTRDLMRCLL
jgi:hypothetical protein